MTKSINIKEATLSDKLLLWTFCCTFFFIPIATSPAVIAGLITLCIWIFSGKFIKKRHMWLNNAWTMPVVLFMLLPWIGLLWSSDPVLGMKFAKKSYYWLYAFAISSISIYGYQKALINSFLYGLSLNVLFSIISFIGLVPMPKEFPSGFMSHINHSLFLLTGILILSFNYKNCPILKQKNIILFLIAAFIFNLCINITRIGYLGLILLAPWILYNITGPKNFLKKTITALIAVGIILSLSPVVHHKIYDAIEDVKKYNSGTIETSQGFRLHMWKGALNIFLQNPIAGTGTGGYKNAMHQYKKDGDTQDFIHPHNSFLYMASNFGIIGIGAFLWLLTTYFKKAWQSRNTLNGFSMLSFGVVFLIGSLTDTQILSLATAIMFALMTGLRTKPTT